MLKMTFVPFRMAQIRLVCAYFAPVKVNENENICTDYPFLIMLLSKTNKSVVVKYAVTLTNERYFYNWKAFVLSDFYHKLKTNSSGLK